MRTSWYLSLSVILAGCESGSEEPVPTEVPTMSSNAEAAGKPNVVLITLDTTRADRIGSYGYDAAATDNIDSLAKAGRQYQFAYSPLPLTIPSHASIFTGFYPPTIDLRNNGTGTLRDESYTLTEHLREHGYATVGSISAFVTSSEWGFQQGFEKFFDDLPPAKQGDFWHNERSGAEVVDDIVKWMSSRDSEQPVFAWAHFYDPHFPYAPPKGYANEVKGKPYDGELAYVDDQIGRLMEVFDPANTVYVIVGDHGESLGNHGELTHGLYVYDSTQRVPFIISGPGVSAATIDEAVSLVDVSPTLLDILDLPALGENLDGTVVPSNNPERGVYMESYQLAQRFGFAPHVAVVVDSLKLIDLPDPELFDLRKDPEELDNLATSRPDDVKRLKSILDGLGFDVPSSDPAHPMDPSISLQLEALGYVEAGFKGDLGADLPDPKLFAETISKSQLAEKHIRHGEIEESLTILRELSEKHPEAIEFKTRQAMVLISARRFEEANAVVEAALEQDPENMMLKYSLAVNRARRGKHAEASILFQEVARSMPFSPRIRTMAAAALYETEGGNDAGIELAFSYLAEHPKDYSLAGWLGVKLALMGRDDEAIKLLEFGILCETPERDVAFLLSGTVNARGDRGRARELMELEVRNYPNNQRAMATLIAYLGKENDWQAVVTVTEAASSSDGLDLVGWHARAQAMFNLGLYKQARVALNTGLSKYSQSSALLLLDANLLAKEGKPDEAKRRFEEAKAAKAKEQ